MASSPLLRMAGAAFPCQSREVTRKKVGFPDFLENIESDLPFSNRSKCYIYNTRTFTV